MVQPSANWKTVEREHGRTVSKTFFERSGGGEPPFDVRKGQCRDESGAFDVAMGGRNQLVIRLDDESTFWGGTLEPSGERAALY